MLHQRDTHNASNRSIWEESKVSLLSIKKVHFNTFLGWALALQTSGENFFPINFSRALKRLNRLIFKWRIMEMDIVGASGQPLFSGEFYLVMVMV